MRILHESTLYEQNCFLTLTYSDEELPSEGSLKKDDFQRFMKRYRKSLEPRKIRNYGCGEYGDETHRPHYHNIIFNHDFEDKKFLKYSPSGHPIYTSATLDHIWGHGDCYIGDVTFESAAYVARYCMKKLTGARKEEYGSLQPEKAYMSRRPGIGAPWLAKWKTDVFPNDFIVINGKKVRVPKYYDMLMKKEEHETETHHGKWMVDQTGNFPYYVVTPKLNDREIRSGARKRSAAKHSHDNTPDRLAVREECHQARISLLPRS